MFSAGLFAHATIIRYISGIGYCVSSGQIDQDIIPFICKLIERCRVIWAGFKVFLYFFFNDGIYHVTAGYMVYFDIWQTSITLILFDQNDLYI